jgi:hypothetical protein
MSKAWVIGFVEAEGSFYITKKGKNKDGSIRMVHGFGISQKEDEIVLKGIKKILHCKTKVRYKDKHQYYILDTTNRRVIKNICDYFDGFLKTNKALEFRI